MSPLQGKVALISANVYGNGIVTTVGVRLLGRFVVFPEVAKEADCRDVHTRASVNDLEQDGSGLGANGCTE